MKRCPTCNRSYEDDAMSFCLDDGTPLVSESAFDPGATIKIPAGRVTNQAPTEVLKEEAIPPTKPALPATEKYVGPAQAAPPERKQSALPWILGAALILGLSAIVVALIVTRNNGPDNSQVAQKTENTPQSSNTSSTTESGASVTTNNAVTPSVTSNPNPAISTSSQTQANKMSETSATAKPTPSPKSTPTPDSSVEPSSPKPTPPTAPRAPVAAGVLNGRATSLPKPAYPPIARAAHASGTVTVQVTVDESGKVISAHAVGGHPLLQQSAVQAAYGARFSPTLMSGQPVKVTGVITYNFEPQ